MVMHSGTASQGHYYTLIRFDAGWASCSDGNVRCSLVSSSCPLQLCSLCSVH